MTEKAFEYVWAPAGLTRTVYPSGRVVEQTLDEAGRVSAVTGASGASPYVNLVTYSPFGGVKSLQYGNGLTESWDYSAARGQARRIEVADGANVVGQWRFGYCSGGSYSSECTSNNGNVLSQNIGPLNVTQSYTYDGLNRLKTMTEGAGVGLTYVYDRFGNRAVLSGSTMPSWPGAPVATVDTPAGAAAVFTPENRWTGSSWDAAGRLTRPQTGAYPALTYDGEGRVIEAVTGATESARSSAVYDGEGRRVKRVVSGVTTYYVYDAQGRLAAEYGGPAGGSGRRYVTGDHLGSTRLVTGSAKEVLERHDYEPFGWELLAGQSGRATGSGYAGTADAVTLRQKFTGKERDSETGLDYFLARYYSAAQGRFTTPDEFTGGIVDPFTGQQVGQPGPLPYADITDPQTLNKYAYVRNSPLRFTDPDGHCGPWCLALIGGAGGATASVISQKWSHPDRDIDWKQVGAAALGSAVAAGTLGLATAPGALVTVLGGETVLETGVAVGAGAAAGSGVVGGIVDRAVSSGGDPNAAIGSPGQIAMDATLGAVTEGAGSAIVRPTVKATTTAGRAVSVGEAKIARGTRPSPSLPQRQAQLSVQQSVAGGATAAAADAANRAREANQQKRKKEEVQH